MKIPSGTTVRGEDGVVVTGIGVLKFRSWGKCTMPFTKVQCFRWPVYYCIAENFQGRELSRIGGKDDFCGENFCGCSLVVPTDTTHAPKFRGENFRE